MFHIIKSIFFIIVAIFCILFAMTNTHEALISIPFAGKEGSLNVGLPTYLFFFIFLFIGTFIGAIFMMIAYASHARRERKLKQKIRLLENELNSSDEKSSYSIITSAEAG